MTDKIRWRLMRMRNVALHKHWYGTDAHSKNPYSHALWLFTLELTT